MKLTPYAMLPNVASLRPHPIANDYPMASVADFDLLKASISERGFLPSEPIVLYGEPPRILDGRNRLNAGNAVGHKWTKENLVLFTGTDEQAEAFSNAKNGARRHLTNEQKAERIKRALSETPDASSREIARHLGVSPATVEKYRAEKSEADKEYDKFRAAWMRLSDANKVRFTAEMKM